MMLIAIRIKHALDAAVQGLHEGKYGQNVADANGFIPAGFADFTR
jgi:hypothetical protein